MAIQPSPYAPPEQLPLGVRRFAYRLAYALLRVYRFVGRPRVTGVKCVLTEGDQILLVRHTYGPAVWELPGGSIKRRESPISAARREMREELGISVVRWNDLGTISGRMHHARDTLHCFQAELRAPALTIDPGELAAARWFPRAELPPDLGLYTRHILHTRQIVVRLDAG